MTTVPARTEVFTKLVKHYMGSPPVSVRPTETCGVVVDRIREAGASAAVLVDRDGALQGIITEQDVTRRIALRLSPDAPAAEVASGPVSTVDAGDRLFHAIGRMRQLGLRHMPVVDGTGGGIVGLLELHVALALAAGRMVDQIDHLTHAGTLAGMERTKQAQVAVAGQLFDDATPAPDIQQFITSINNDLYGRIVELSLRDMEQAGWGAPPARFDVIVMGSGGRGENFLYPDQDNGFIIEDYPDADHDTVDPWFVELARRMTDGLNQVGFPYCNGHVMAVNPLWRKTLAQWRAQTEHWINKGAGTVLRLADIFFDFAHVHGDGDMTLQLRRHVTEAAARPFFLREMFELDADHNVALGWFNRLLLDREEGPGRGKLNLKMTGTLPLVGAVRIAALANHVPATGTLERIDHLRDKEVLSADERDYLAGAYRHITDLMLRQQVRDFEAGRPVCNHVAPADITRRERDMLVNGFKAIRRFRHRLRTELTGDVF